jgi:two-component system, NarL family, response regulator LiaR
MVVHNHPVVLRGLVACLGFEPDIDVVATATSGEEALVTAAEVRPDLVLIARTMAGIGGIEATRQLVKTQPETRVIILSASGGPDRQVEAAQSGALRYMLLETPPSTIAQAVRDATMPLAP